MKGILFTLLCFFIISTSYAQDSWVAFKSSRFSHADFTAEFPAEPYLKYQTLETEVGKVENETYYTYDEEQMIIYTVNYVEYGKDFISSDSTALITDLLMSYIEDITEQVDGTLVYTSIEEKGKKNAVLFRITYNQGEGILKGRAIYVKDRVYTLQTFAPKHKSLSDDINRFLYSFTPHISSE